MKGLSSEQTKMRESKASQIFKRVQMSLVMIFSFFGIIWAGHPFLVVLTVVIQVGCFRELVNVRYDLEKEKKAPLFRTMQWALFILSMTHSYGKQFRKMGIARSFTSQLPSSVAKYVDTFEEYQNLFSSSGYMILFVTFVSTLRKSILRYQIANLIWTAAVMVYIVKQVQGATMLIFSGIFWFILPCGLVVANDCFAYICGMAMGGALFRTRYEIEVERKEDEPLGIETSVTPGGGLQINEVKQGDDDLVEGWNRMKRSDSFCQVQKGHVIERVNGESRLGELSKQRGKLKIELSKKATFLSISPNKTWEGFIGAIFCTVIFAWFVSAFLSQFLWITCPQHELRPFAVLDCEPSEAFALRALPFALGSYRWAQIHAIVLACLASFVAPFGGFLASGIKRAYGLKDFGDLIPGHGGFMDRMDCQLIMLFCAHAYFTTFVEADISEEKRILLSFGSLSQEGKDRIYRQLSAAMGMEGQCTPGQ